MEINSRMSSILYLIVASKGRISLESLANETAVSKRALYYDLGKINECFSNKGIPAVVLENGECVIEEEYLDMVEEILESGNIHLASREQRMRIEILLIALSKEQVTIEGLSQEFDVSRNTIQTDLKLLKRECGGKTALKYTNRNGYYFEGDELSVRNYISDNLAAIKNRGIWEMILKLLNRLAADSLNLNPEFGDVYQIILEEIEIYSELISTSFIDHFVCHTAAMIMVAVIRNGLGNECSQIGQIGKRTFSYTEEFGQIKIMLARLRGKGIILSGNEEFYAAYLLLGMKRIDFQGEMNQKVIEIVDVLLHHIEKQRGQIIERKEELRKMLCLHMEPMLYRLKLGLHSTNLLLEDIRKMYPRGFDMVETSVRAIGGEIGELITEDEISFLVMFVESHFANIEMGGGITDARKILIICGAGVSTSVFIRTQLQEILGENYEYELSAVSAVREKNFLKYKLVISTVRDVGLPAETIYVSPILSERDTDHIIQKLCSEPMDLRKVKLEDLINIIERQISSKEELGKIRRNLFYYFQRRNA